MKITNRKEVDADILPAKQIIERQFGCKVDKVYVFNLEHEDGAIGAITGYFNKRTNEIYMFISKKVTEGIEHIGAVIVGDGEYGIYETILDGDKEVLKTYRAIVDELALDIYKNEHKED